MKFAIITSIKDQAGINIHDSLVKNYGFLESGNFEEKSKHFLDIKKNSVELFVVNNESVFEEKLDERIDADYFIFATRHQSSSETPSFTVHPIGNWEKAEMGGEEKKLCLAPSALLKLSLNTLNEKIEEYGMNDVSVLYESTHHGPLLSKPAMFIEIGSTRRQWSDERFGNLMSHAIISAIEKFAMHKSSSEKFRAAIGIGGLHYANNFLKIIRNTDIAMGHICPKYNLHNLNKSLIKQALEKTENDFESDSESSSGKAEKLVILDWKGLGDEKERIVNVLEELNIRYLKTTGF